VPEPEVESTMERLQRIRSASAGKQRTKPAQPQVEEENNKNEESNEEKAAEAFSLSRRGSTISTEGNLNIEGMETSGERLVRTRSAVTERISEKEHKAASTGMRRNYVGV